MSERKEEERIIRYVNKRLAQLEANLLAQACSCDPIPGQPGRNGQKGQKGEEGTPGTSGLDLISFGATAILPVGLPGLLSVVNYLIPFGRGVAIPVVGLADTAVNFDPVTAGLHLPLTVARTARNPVLTITLGTLQVGGAVTFTLGTITPNAPAPLGPIGGTFTPSAVSITVPAANFVNIGTFTFNNATTAVFPAGSILAVRVTAAPGISITAGLTAEFNFELV